MEWPAEVLIQSSGQTIGIEGINDTSILLHVIGWDNINFQEPIRHVSHCTYPISLLTCEVLGMYHTTRTPV